MPSTATKTQKFVVLIWVFLGILSFGVAPVLTVLLLFTSLRNATLIYLLWVYFIDRKTSERGGRALQILRNMPLWKPFYDYFPVNAVLSTPLQLDPKRNYFVAAFPHGIYSLGINMDFRCNLANAKTIFRNHKMYFATLPINFFVPFYRELLFSSGSVSSSENSLDFLLSKPEGGNVVGIIPGGAAEALYSNPGEDYKLLVGRRKGYVRVALKHGAPILPLFSFGEIEVMEQARYEEGSWLFEVQKLLKRLTRVNFIVPKDGLRGMVPRSVPITAVYGTPIDVPKVENPTQEQIDEYHRKVVKQLMQLFEEHKHKYLADPENTKLVIL